MGYRRMTVEHVYEILRRWHAGQSVSRISVAEECDRKTVRKYIQKFNEAGLRIDKKLPGKDLAGSGAGHDLEPEAVDNLPIHRRLTAWVEVDSQPLGNTGLILFVHFRRSGTVLENVSASGPDRASRGVEEIHRCPTGHVT